MAYFKTKKKPEKKLDALWRKAVMARAKGQCEYWNCGRRENLNAHHVFSRSRRSTRWSIDNGLCLCPLHHALGNESAHKDPEFLKKILGEVPGYKPIRTVGWYQMLRLSAYTPSKTDPFFIELYLKEELKRFEAQN